MKIRYIYIAVATVLLFSFYSCSKYLDKKSSTGINVPTALNDLQALLDDGNNMNVKRTPSISEASTDNYFLLQSTFDTKGERFKAVYQWVPYDNYSWPNDWAFNYVPIYNANYCLERIGEVEIDQANKATWNNVKGSALFYRAYYFLQLTWSFAKAYDDKTENDDLGIPLRMTSDFNAPSVRASVKETYQRILSDTKESINYLPNIPLNPYRPSKGAAYGLLARTYLSMRQYDSAYRYSDLCLQVNNKLMDFQGDLDIPGSLIGTSSPFAKFNKETIFYTEASLELSQLTSPAFALIDTSLYSSYALNDLRRKAFFTASSRFQRFKGHYTRSTVLFTGIATDEFYLSRAECSARKGDVPAALNDLNTLLSKRYDPSFVPVTAVDASDALNKILIERRKELLMRGLRFIDIKRLNKDGANIIPKRLLGGQAYSIPPNDNRYALPIPREVILQSGITQNPQ